MHPLSTARDNRGHVGDAPAAAHAARTDPGRRRNIVSAVILALIVGAMVGLAFASVPLYRLFCQVTGYGGTPKIAANAAPAAAADTTVTVRFDANVDAALPWQFYPASPEMTVRVGETALAHYVAKNDSDTPVTGHAVFNVAPYKAGPYFVKVECFCFTEQLLQPGQEVSMPVSFFVDPDMVIDRGTREVRTITLSYTFFRSTTEEQAETRERAPAEATPPAAAERRRAGLPERSASAIVSSRERQP